MTTKIKTQDDCRSGRDFAELGQSLEIDVAKVGSYNKLSKNGTEIYVPDTNRDLPKPVREQIVKLFELLLAAGLLVAIVVMSALWVGML